MLVVPRSNASEALADAPTLAGLSDAYEPDVYAERGHDLPAVGAADDDLRAGLAVQDLAQPGGVVGQRGLRELWGGDGVAVGLKLLHDGAPARPVCPRAVYEHDVR